MTPPGESVPRSFWVGLVLGVVPMVWGVRLYLEATPDLARRLDLVTWLVGLDLAHDLLLAPAVVAIGYVVGRAAPAWARPAVQVALLLSGVVLVVGLLPLLGTAGDANPTIQPIDYAATIGSVLASIWLGAAVAAVVTRRRLVQ